MTDLPRFTGSLRAFTGITGSCDPYKQQRLHQELVWKRKCQVKGTGLPWNEIRKLAETGKDKKQVRLCVQVIQNCLFFSFILIFVMLVVSAKLSPLLYPMNVLFLWLLPMSRVKLL